MQHANSLNGVSGNLGRQELLRSQANSKNKQPRKPSTTSSFPAVTTPSGSDIFFSAFGRQSRQIQSQQLQNNPTSAKKTDTSAYYFRSEANNIDLSSLFGHPYVMIPPPEKWPHVPPALLTPQNSYNFYYAGYRFSLNLEPEAQKAYLRSKVTEFNIPVGVLNNGSELIQLPNKQYFEVTWWKQDGEIQYRLKDLSKAAEIPPNEAEEFVLHTQNNRKLKAVISEKKALEDKGHAKALLFSVFSEYELNETHPNATVPIQTKDNQNGFIDFAIDFDTGDLFPSIRQANEPQKILTPSDEEKQRYRTNAIRNVGAGKHNVASNIIINPNYAMATIAGIPLREHLTPDGAYRIFKTIDQERYYIFERTNDLSRISPSKYTEVMNFPLILSRINQLVDASDIQPEPGITIPRPENEKHDEENRLLDRLIQFIRQQEPRK